jgi:hypothetical protein
MPQIVPFPILQRKAWLADLIDEGVRLGLYEMSALFTRRVRERKELLRSMGIAEDLVQAEIGPVKEILRAEVRARTAKLNKNYKLVCDLENFPGAKPGQMMAHAY